jgi:signal transduction histidine kinase/ActR/RegA family two-component response regulator
LRVKGLIVVAVPLVALLGTTSASLVLQGSEAHERNVGTAARNLTTAANLVLADMVNAETGVRGYAAARDPLFLAPYNLMLTRIGAERGSLQKAAAAEGDGREQRAVGVTASTVQSELARMHAAVRGAVTVQNLRPALEHEKSTMDRLRRQIAAITIRQHDRVSRLATAINVLDGCGLVLGLLAGLAGIALFTSGIARRVEANAANAARLGEGQPLQPDAEADDEVGRVSQSLIRAEQLLARRAVDLIAARDEALSATRAKNAFLSSTSHELRTPLNAILGFTQLLQLSDLCDEDADGVGRILGAGRHLLALINELIDIARIESGDLSLSLEPVLVRPVIQETSQLMAPIAAEHAITITADCAHPALTVCADQQRLTQVLVNLISNAIKYNRRGGTVTVSCHADTTSQASITVTDTGPGISPGNLDRIFIPFERLGAEQTTTEGTGIGLPLARSLTEAMAGQLTASSTPGQGSAFTISLPRAPDLAHQPGPGLVPASPAPAPAGPHALAGASLSILYIEDNPANVEVVTRFLHTRPGTTLRSETSGRAGIESAARDQPDLILLDLHLPDLHGSQVLSELMAEPATAAIPVVVLSADASHGVVRRLIADGALAYLTKPIELTQLAELLSTFTDAPAAHQRPQPASRITPA